MRIRHRNHEPYISASAFVAPTAVVAWRVSVAEHCRILYGAVLDAEDASIEVGAFSIISEQSVLALPTNRIFSRCGLATM
jgi:carbonic anhydrase/acetyltransferase-like protein (isoleucine patch superfamily)